jgi:hypothetical protein
MALPIEASQNDMALMEPDDIDLRQAIDTLARLAARSGPIRSKPPVHSVRTARLLYAPRQVSSTTAWSHRSYRNNPAQF